jgi:hypothetical protein
MKPGGNHLGIVEDQEVAGAKIGTEVPEAAVREGVRRPVEDQQPAHVPLFGR